MSTTRIDPEITYDYVKGQGWVPITTGIPGRRTAEQTARLTWVELCTGDAVYVISNGVTRIGRVHQEGHPLRLEPDDTGAWYRGGGGLPPYRIHEFYSMRTYGRGDRAWEGLVGVSFPDGKDYEV